MEFTIIGLFSLSLLLFVLSFLQKDRAKDVEKQLENLSIQLMQEMYQLKKKVSVLEEEIMISSNGSENLSLTGKRPLTRDDVLEMYEDGYSISDISIITNRREDEIEQLLAEK